MSLLIGNPPGTESPRKRSRWHLPASTWYGISAKAFQVASPCFHLVRNLRESVPGGISLLPPGTESPQKRSRCHFLPSTWHGIPAKAFQVALLAFHLARNSCKSVPGGISLPSTWHGIPAKVFQVALLVVHLPRYLCESVPGGISPLPTCHGFPVKEFQVAPLVVHLARNPRESVPGGISLSPTCHGIFAKACQVSHPASHLARKPCESVSGVSSRLPPGTETLRKRVRCHFSPSTWHGIPAKACQVSFPASHLARYHCESVSGGISLPPTCHGNIVPS